MIDYKEQKEVQEMTGEDGFDPCLLELKNPIKFGKDNIEWLKFREPTARDMRALRLDGSLTFGDSLDIAQKLTETTRGVIDRLSLSDATAVVERVAFLLTDGG